MYIFLYAHNSQGLPSLWASACVNIINLLKLNDTEVFFRSTLFSTLPGLSSSVTDMTTQCNATGYKTDYILFPSESRLELLPNPLCLTCSLSHHLEWYTRVAVCPPHRQPGRATQKLEEVVLLFSVEAQFRVPSSRARWAAVSQR